MAVITVIIRDNYIGFTEPLIYTVTVNNPHDEKEVLAEVLRMRAGDVGEKPEDLSIDLMFAFAGDISTIEDWRTGGDW